MSHILINISARIFAVALLVVGGGVATARPGVADQMRYANTLTTLRAAATESDAIASVSPGTPLKVLTDSNGALQVEVTGWSPAGGEKYLFSEMGQRILFAKMTDQGVAGRVVVSQKKDYYESVWQDVRLTGWIARSDTSDTAADIWDAASTLFHQRCTRCHALHRATEFKANQWPSILKIMTVRAGLSVELAALVTQYLQTHAKDQKLAADVANEPEPATSEADPSIPKITGDAKLAAEGEAAFADNSCSACHGEDANTPAIPAYPRLAGQNADYVFKQLQDFKSGARANDEFEVMKDGTAELPEADMRAIAYWLSTL